MKTDLLDAQPYPRKSAFIQLGDRLIERPAAKTTEELLEQERAWCERYPVENDAEADKRYEMVMKRLRGF